MSYLVTNRFFDFLDYLEKNSDLKNSIGVHLKQSLSEFLLNQCNVSVFMELELLKMETQLELSMNRI